MITIHKLELTNEDLEKLQRVGKNLPQGHELKKWFEELIDFKYYVRIRTEFLTELAVQEIQADGLAAKYIGPVRYYGILIEKLEVRYGIQRMPVQVYTHDALTRYNPLRKLQFKDDNIVSFGELKF